MKQLGRPRKDPNQLAKKQKYALVQLPEEIHAQLKEYCDSHGFKYSSLVSNLIKKYLRENKDKTLF